MLHVPKSPEFGVSPQNSRCGQFNSLIEVTDECGRTSTASQIIYIEDSIAPSVTAPSKVTLECGSLPLPFNTGFANASDTCSPTQAPTYRDYTITSQFFYFLLNLFIYRNMSQHSNDYQILASH